MITAEQLAELKAKWDAYSPGNGPYSTVPNYVEALEQYIDQFESGEDYYVEVIDHEYADTLTTIHDSVDAEVYADLMRMHERYEYIMHIRRNQERYAEQLLSEYRDKFYALQDRVEAALQSLNQPLTKLK